MKRKVLFVASIDKHIIRFHIPSLKWFYDRGFEVHVACNGFSEISFCKKIHQIDFVRIPLSFKHIKAYSQIEKLLDTEKFSVLHCHTSVSSFLTRVAAIKYRKRDQLKVIYTTHGFHFYKGSPIINWILYYSIEKLASYLNDCLITINTEDYLIAKSNFKCKDVRLISGLGVDKDKYFKPNLNDKLISRKKWNIPENAIVFIYVAEFIKRKNHVFLLKVAKQIQNLLPNSIILLPGRGLLLDDMKSLATSLNINSFVIFPGFIEEIADLIKVADLCVSPSKQEGLGLHIIEAMMTGLPVIATNVSGHREIINDGYDGFIYPVNDETKFLAKIKSIILDNELYKRISINGLIRAQDFEMKKANKELFEIYDDLLF